MSSVCKFLSLLFIHRLMLMCSEIDALAEKIAADIMGNIS